MIIHRQESSANEESLGVMQIPANQKDGFQLVSTGQENASPNSFTTTNTIVYNNILYNTQYILNLNKSTGNNVKASIELRIYHDDSKPINTALKKGAEGIKNQLLDPNGGPKSLSIQNQPIPNKALPPGSVTVVEVNMNDKTSRSSPSQKAIDAARGLMAATSVNSGSVSSSNPTGNDDGTDVATISANNNALRTALFSYIIDCWISFEQVSDAVANSTTT
jgi:hypothetical protein